MDILKFGPIFALAICLAGCASVAHVRVSDFVSETPTDPHHIEVFFQTAPRKVRPIAMVVVARQGEGALYAVELLKEEAATLGADAIVDLELSYTTGFFPNLRVSGLAVKYE